MQRWTAKGGNRGRWLNSRKAVVNFEGRDATEFALSFCAGDVFSLREKVCIRRTEQIKEVKK